MTHGLLSTLSKDLKNWHFNKTVGRDMETQEMRRSSMINGK